MKRSLLSFALLLSLPIFFGCEDISSEQPASLIEVGFDCLAPSISFDDAPLVATRASTYTEEPRYIIQIFHNGSPYAYGVFNDLSKQTVTMEEGKTYSMEVSYFPNGHCLPFTHDGKGNYLTDGFVYSIDNYISPNGSFTDGGFIYFIPSIKYWAENVQYTASENNKTINLELQAWIFGLLFKVNNLSEGTLKITCPGSFDRMPELTFTPDNTEYEAIYSMYDHLMYDHSYYTYTPYVQIIYTDTDGIETSIFRGDIPTSRLKKTIVTINLKDKSGKKGSSFSVNLENYDITEGKKVDINQE